MRRLIVERLSRGFRKEGDYMQRWEYRFIGLAAIPRNLFVNKGWSVSEIDEQALPNSNNAEVYPSVLAFCNHMGLQGWELLSLNETKSMAAHIRLYFKR